MVWGMRGNQSRQSEKKIGWTVADRKWASLMKAASMGVKVKGFHLSFLDYALRAVCPLSVCPIAYIPSLFYVLRG